MYSINNFCFPVIGPVLRNTRGQVPNIKFGCTCMKKFMRSLMQYRIRFTAKKTKFILRQIVPELFIMQRLVQQVFGQPAGEGI